MSTVESRPSFSPLGQAPRQILVTVFEAPRVREETWGKAAQSLYRPVRQCSWLWIWRDMESSLCASRLATIIIDIAIDRDWRTWVSLSKVRVGNSELSETKGADLAVAKSGIWESKAERKSHVGRHFVKPSIVCQEALKITMIMHTWISDRSITVLRRDWDLSLYLCHQPLCIPLLGRTHSSTSVVRSRPQNLPPSWQ